MTNYATLVHPQAMLVMSNHLTRIKYDSINVQLPVHVGILLGQARGSHIEVNSALEILVTGEKGNLQVSQQFLEHAYKDLHQPTYINEVLIGWYTCGKLDDTLRNEVGPKIEQLFSNYDSEVLLVGEFDYDVKNPPAEGKSPLTLYFNNNSVLVPIDFTYEAEPAERIAMIQFQSELDLTKNVLQKTGDLLDF